MKNPLGKQGHRRPKRQAYVLVMCLLTVAISSSIVLTLFNMLRLQTAESAARRQQVVAASLVEASLEHAIAVLIDRPDFRGTLGPIAVPEHPERVYSVSIADASGNIALTVNCRAGRTVRTFARQISPSQLANRRAALGL